MSISSEFAIENAFSRRWAVDLVSLDAGKIDWNRADDLIVRTTFMRQNSKPFFSDKDADD